MDLADEPGFVFTGNLDFAVLNHGMKLYDFHRSPPKNFDIPNEYMDTKIFPRSALVTYSGNVTLTNLPLSSWLLILPPLFRFGLNRYSYQEP